MAKLDTERFQYIEAHNLEGVTAQQLAEKFWISEKSAACWLSKWTNYYSEFMDTIYHFLKCEPDPSGGKARYHIGPFPWAERLTNPHWEDYQEHIDLEGLTGIQRAMIRDNTLRSYTDHDTHKRTTTHIRTTREKLYYISTSGGITPGQYASQFNVSVKSASTILSRWRSKGFLEHDKFNGKYTISKELKITQPKIFYAKVEMNGTVKGETLMEQWGKD